MAKQSLDRCVKCRRPRDEVRLDTCVICRRFFCRRCATARHGKVFCSPPCADYFFFGGEDDQE